MKIGRRVKSRDATKTGTRPLAEYEYSAIWLLGSPDIRPNSPFLF